MNKRIMTHQFSRICALATLFLCMSAQALAYDGASAQQWMERFAQALSEITPVNDAEQTSDPARAGQYLIEYPFGTVLSGVPETPVAQEISAIDVRTAQVTDCRGVRVGMGIEAALDGGTIGAADAEWVMLTVSEAERGWSWANVGGDGVCGVEYVAYAEEARGLVAYTLTYVLEDDVVTAIRMRASNVTQAQAQEGMQTAQAMLEAQDRARIARRSEAPLFGKDDLQVQGGAALGVPVASLIARMGEPRNVQTLPQAAGRLLLYDGAVVRLAFDEATGEELVRGVSVCGAAIARPRGLTVGMPVREAAGLFACEADVTARGGTMYLAGEAEGEAPYGVALVSDGELLLRYACETDGGKVAWLQAVIEDGAVACWSLVYESDAEGGM